VGIRRQRFDLLHSASRPPDSHRNLSSEFSQPKNKLLARLRKIAVTRTHCFYESVSSPGHYYLDPSANSITVSLSPLQSKAKKPSSTGRIISQEA
tara:strand:- start:196 stop:480 length:285 start_codon:yes stop_codon:yes gene_type:complete